MFLPKKILEKKLLEMLAEDVGQGDITTELLILPETKVEAKIIAKESGIIAGIDEILVLLASLGLKAEASLKDGEKVEPGQIVIRVSGDARTILSAERTTLNILSRMSGIATTTRKLTEKLQKAGFKTKLACTRKTAPGLMYFDKKAILIGGGDTHRLHLDDMILIKDNHLALAGSIEKVVKKAKQKASFSKKIEVEVTDAEKALAAAKAGADIIMFDNFSQKEIERAFKLLDKAALSRKALIEISGGITAENILSFVSAKVAIVSMGELTNSVKALNMSLEITKVK